MKEPKIDVKKVERCLKRLKPRKSAGPNKSKPDLYKVMLGSQICLTTLVKCFERELEIKEKPKGWKKSRTKMVEKKRRPMAKDLRPIALTDVSYKIFMSMVKEDIDDHLILNEEDNECQAGFTEGGRIEDNILVLQYCVEESFRERKTLIVTSIDFRKAFDSVKRSALIEVMKEYRIHPKVIDAVADIYTGDKTNIDLGEGLEQEIEVTSGIRQGCTGSTTLFKLVTLLIIKKIEEEGRGFVNRQFKIGTLFFADDALVLAESIEEAKHNIKLLIETGKKCGLEINKEKSNILIYNMKDKY